MLINYSCSTALPLVRRWLAVTFCWRVHKNQNFTGIIMRRVTWVHSKYKTIIDTFYDITLDACYNVSPPEVCPTRRRRRWRWRGNAFCHNISRPRGCRMVGYQSNYGCCLNSIEGIHHNIVSYKSPFKCNTALLVDKLLLVINTRGHIKSHLKIYRWSKKESLKFFLINNYDNYLKKKK